MNGWCLTAPTPRRELKAILADNVRILVLLTEAMELAEENTRILKSDPPH